VEVGVRLGVSRTRTQQPGHQVDDPLTPVADRVGEGLRAGGLRVQHDPRGAVGVDVGQERQDGVAQHVARRQLEVDVRAHRFDEPAQLAVQARSEQLLLGAVVQVEHRLGDLGLAGDRVHRRLVIAVDGEHFDGGVEHLLLAYGTRQPLGTTGHPSLPFRRELTQG